MKQKQQPQQARSQHKSTGTARQSGQHLIQRQNQQQRSWGQQVRHKGFLYLFALCCALLLFSVVGLYGSINISHAQAASSANSIQRKTTTTTPTLPTLTPTSALPTPTPTSALPTPTPTPTSTLPTPTPCIIPIFCPTPTPAPCVTLLCATPTPTNTPIPIVTSTPTPIPGITPTPVVPGVTPTTVPTNPGGAGTGPTTPPTATPRPSTSTSQTLNGTGGGGGGGGTGSGGGGGTPSTNANGSGGTSSSGSGKPGSSGSSFLVLIIVFIVILVIIAGAILVYLAYKQRNKPATLPPSVPATPLLMDDVASPWTSFSNANMANNAPPMSNMSFAGGMPPAQASMAGIVNPGFYPDASANYGPLSMNGIQEMPPTSQYGNYDMPTMAANTMNMQPGQGMFTEPALTEVGMAPVTPASPIEQQNMGNLTDPFMDAIIRQAQMGLFFLQGKDAEPGADLGD